jgi:type 1 glutamine amidotransferase
MARKVLVFGLGGGIHYNEILSGILIGWFVAHDIGEMTYVGQAKPVAPSLAHLKTTRLTLASFPWDTLPRYDVLVTLGQIGVFDLQFDEHGVRHFKYPACPDNITDAQVEAIRGFVASGKGCVAIHTAGLRSHKAFNELIGGGFVKHGPIHEFTVDIVDGDHPITRGLQPFTTTDELFFTEHDAGGIHVLLSARENGEQSPQAWVKSFGEGRVVYITLGHDERTFLNPSFLKLVERSTLWAARSI